MDFSKLSNEDLLALKSGDYTKVSDEGLMLLKGNSTPQKPSLLKKGAILGAKSLPIVGGITGGILASPGVVTTAGGAALGAAGGEALKQLSLRALGEPVPETSLEAAKEIGKAGAIEGGMSALGVGALKPISKLGKLVTTPSRGAIGKTIETINKAKGIALEGEAVNAPRTRKAIITWAKALKDIGDPKTHLGDTKMLNFVREETGNLLDFLKVAKQSGQPKQVVAKGTIARLSKIKDSATKALTKEVPELKKPFEQYGIAKSRQEIVSQLGQAVPSFIKGPAKAAISLGKYLAK